MKGWKTIFQENGPKKQAGVAILISNKINCQPKVIKKEKELLLPVIFVDKVGIVFLWLSSFRFVQGLFLAFSRV